MSGWPTPQDYNEAIQSPAINLRDPDLARSTPELTSLGLPRPISGNFASVYRLRGDREWAVRCFFRPFDDMAQRYAAIGQHLAAHRLPYTVGFSYVEDGIRVRDRPYPVLKMEWVEGRLLSEYVGETLGRGESLRRLAGQWRDMVAALERAGVAHGDMQHGNVLVAGERLVLVDYDGMYVPALRGLRGHEIGHVNYQHPARTGADFGPHMDRFSAWAIYLSLLALAHDPSLWDRLHGGDECLLLRAADLRNPRGGALDVLRGAAQPEVQEVARRLTDALEHGPRVLQPFVPRPAVPRRPDWLPAPPPPRFRTLLPGRLVAGMAVAYLAALIVLKIPFPLLPIALLSIPSLLTATYGADPAARRLWRLRLRRFRLIARLRLADCREGVRSAREARFDRYRAARTERLHRRLQDERKRLNSARRTAEEILDGWRAAVQEAEEEERLIRLASARRQYVARVLHGSRVSSSGQPLWVRVPLYLWGCRHAGQVLSSSRIPLPPGRASRVKRWAEKVESDARARAPLRLPPEVDARLGARYAAERMRIDRAAQRASAALTRIDAVVVTSWAADLDRLHAARVTSRAESSHPAADRVLRHRRLTEVEAELERLVTVGFGRYLLALTGLPVRKPASLREFVKFR